MSAVLLARLGEVEKQRDMFRRRLNHTVTSRAYWRNRAKAAEFTPSRPDVARELDFLRRDNARLRARVEALGGTINVRAT